MRAYRLTTVEIQKLASIAEQMDVAQTKVISSLIAWFWKEYMSEKQTPQPVEPKALKAIVNKRIRG